MTVAGRNCVFCAQKNGRDLHPFYYILVVIYALVLTQAFRVSSQTWPTSHCIAVSFPWLPHPSATANDVESIRVKNATGSAFIMRPFLGFNRDKISKNAYIFKYFWILPDNRSKNRLLFANLPPKLG